MTEPPPAHTLHRHLEPHAVVRLGPGTEVPVWVSSATLMSVTATAAETSIVCASAAVPRKTRHEGPYTVFEVAGPLDLTLTGVLSELLAPLTEAGISVFVVSTYDTDWVLVPDPRADDAVTAWQGRGHTVVPAAAGTGGAP